MLRTSEMVCASRNTIRAISEDGGGEKAWGAFEPFTHGNAQMAKFNTEVYMY